MPLVRGQASSDQLPLLISALLQPMQLHQV